MKLLFGQKHRRACEFRTSLSVDAPIPDRTLGGWHSTRSPLMSDRKKRKAASAFAMSLSSHSSPYIFFIQSDGSCLENEEYC